MTEESIIAAEPRLAATVILIREYEGEVQAYLLKRSAQSGFMPENYVFPGGTVDVEDSDSRKWEKHVDMDVEGVVRKLGGVLSDEDTYAHSIAAIRETFEEAGVFLAHKDEQFERGLEKICELRRNNVLHRGWLRERVVSEGWILAFSRLSRWAHWITPTIRTRRYDTRFFLAFMPQAQECVSDSRETTHGIWVSPEEGLTGNLQGKLPLSPPTLVTLHELLQYPDISSLEKEVKIRLWGQARLPRLIPSTDGALILLPWDPGYDQQPQTDTKLLSKASISVGEPFSRMCYHDRIWRPAKM